MRLTFANLLIHGLKSIRRPNSVAIVVSQSMKVTDFAADAARKYKRFQVSDVRFRDGRRVQCSDFMFQIRCYFFPDT